MGKSKAPPPPDYGPIAIANEKAAKLSSKVAMKQLAWAKEQYAKDSKLVTPIVKRATKAMQDQARWAKRDRARYEKVYQPLENELIKKGRQYSSETYQNEQAGKAQADVSQQFEMARNAAQDQLESFGVDPTQTRAGALDLNSRLQEATARASAGNQARERFDRIGTAIMGEMVNVGKGYPGQTAVAMQGSAQSGNSAVNSTLANTATGSQAMGNPTQWMGLGNQALGNWGNLVSGIYATQMEGYKARINASSGIGGAIGGIMGGLMGLSDEREKDNIREVGETHDGQPIYSFTYKGDDEPRMGLMAQDVEERDPQAVATDATGRKFVNYDRALQDSAVPVTEQGNGRAIPDEVVRWHGEKFFQKLVREAEQGRAQAIPT